MDKEQILALAKKADETATQYLQCAGEYHPDYHSVRDEHFYHAAIAKATKPLEDQLTAAQNLLARIHGDGGHHQDKVGFLQGCTDAETKYCQLVGELDTAKYQLAKAEQQAKELSDSVAQKVAEACALYIHSTKGAVGSINMAEAVLSGEWRKFVKGV